MRKAEFSLKPPKIIDPSEILIQVTVHDIDDYYPEGIADNNVAIAKNLQHILIRNNTLK